MTTQTVRLTTIGRIAEILGEPIHRVRHVIDTRQHISHCATAGRARLYDCQAVAQIRHELTAIDARKGASNDK